MRRWVFVLIPGLLLLAACSGGGGDDAGPARTDSAPDDPATQVRDAVDAYFIALAIPDADIFLDLHADDCGPSNVYASFAYFALTHRASLDPTIDHIDFLPDGRARVLYGPNDPQLWRQQDGRWLISNCPNGPTPEARPFGAPHPCHAAGDRSLFCRLHPLPRFP